jgi:hypothetical protein
MFSEPYEADILWLKLKIENPFVDKWVIVENCYTFQGKKKPLCLLDVLSNTRFSEFRDKIHIITANHNYNFDYEPSLKLLLKRKLFRFINKIKNNQKYLLISYSELAAFYCEINQRQLAVDYIKKEFSDEDIVITSDTDEILDLNEGKDIFFKNIINENKTPFYLYRRVFCYDFDNFTNRERYLPIIRVKDLKKRKHSLHYYKHPAKRNIVKSDIIFFFEYSYCFDKNSLIRKLNTFSHVTDIGEETVDFSFANNIKLCNSNNITDKHLNSKDFFFTKELLTPANSPLYIREHINEIKLNTINNNYIENRKKNGLIKS